MFQKIIITILGVLMFVNGALAQRTWSLERCIRHVQQSNTTSMRSANLEVDKAKVTREIHEASRQPDLGVRSNVGLNLGRTVDPSTNAFDNQSIGYNSLSLETNYTLYDGNRTKKSIEKSKSDILAREAEARQLGKDLSLQVLQAYLRILMAEEQLANAQKNLDQTNDWYIQTKRLVDGEIRSLADLRSVEVQVSKDNQKVIDRKNFLDQSYVALKKILELDPSLSFKIKKPSEIPAPGDDVQKLSFKKTYSKALKTQPGIEAGEHNLKSMELAEEIAKLGKMPIISLFGGVWSNYSTANPDFSKPDSTNAFNQKNSWEVLIVEPGENRTLEWTTVEGIEYPTTPYFKQLWNNLGYGLGIQIYVPILDQKKSKLNGELAQLEMRKVQEQNIRMKQQLRADIQNAINDVVAAADKLEAADRTYRLLEEAILSMKRKLSMGNINPFEYKTTLNERDQAEIELVIAKYEFLFKKMIVDFYEGKTLKLE